LRKLEIWFRNDERSFEQIDRAFNKFGLGYKNIMNTNQINPEIHLLKSINLLLELPSFTPELNSLKLIDVPVSYKLAQQFLKFTVLGQTE